MSQPLHYAARRPHRVTTRTMKVILIATTVQCLLLAGMEGATLVGQDASAFPENARLLGAAYVIAQLSSGVAFVMAAAGLRALRWWAVASVAAACAITFYWICEMLSDANPWSTDLFTLQMSLWSAVTIVLPAAACLLLVFPERDEGTAF